MNKKHKEELSVDTVQWLQQRQRLGNWFDISDADVIPFDITRPMRTILHMFQLAISPEIRRRIASLKLNDGFILSAAQLVQPLKGPWKVRLNEEIRGVVMFRSTRSIKEGDPISISDLKHLEGFDLLEDELDSGHFTMFWHGTGWNGSFDFRGGRAISAKVLDTALEFWKAAQYARNHDLIRVCWDNLFNACELASKARLILLYTPSTNGKTHRIIHSRINKWASLGNVDQAFVTLFNRLSNSRSKAKYEFEANIDMPTESDLKIALCEIEQLRKALGLRTNG